MKNIFKRSTKMLQLHPKQLFAIKARVTHGPGYYIAFLLKRKDADINKIRRPDARGVNKNGFPISFIELGIIAGGLFAIEASNVPGSGNPIDIMDPINEKVDYVIEVIRDAIKFGRSLQFRGDLLSDDSISAIVKYRAEGKECIARTDAYKLYCK